MNKKILNIISIASVALTFLFTIIGIAIGENGWKMCIVAMIFSLCALVCLLLGYFYPKFAKNKPLIDTTKIDKKQSIDTPTTDTTTTSNTTSTTTTI